MIADNQLYVLNTDAMLSAEVALEPTEYQGQLVLGGPDAAIEIRERQIIPYMHGALTTNPTFTAFVEGYHHAILRAVRKIAIRNDDVVVIAGKWHHVEYDHEPFFAPYVIHVRSVDGAVRSQPYDVLIFDTDDLEEGRDTYVSIPKLKKPEIIRGLRALTESLLGKSGSWPTSSGEPRFSGVLWRPEDKTRSAVYTHFAGRSREQILEELEIGEYKSAFEAVRNSLREANAKEEITENLRLAVRDLFAVAAQSPQEKAKSAIRRMLSIFATTGFGVLAEEPVFRLDHPVSDTCTLEDIANSTTAPGYWFQMRIHDELNPPMFSRFNDEDRLWDFKPRILRRRTDGDDDSLLGCLYASDWEDAGSGYEKRTMAIGPVPKLSW